ncbi:hypothetical protein pipiens_014267 [Culex pipiens pipiens]|uniref:Uncharacterized protein n=1 Tax=Culex pipiens pipiens TaxID=38569 RepID=A0ABD1CVE2_CULPP
MVMISGVPGRELSTHLPTCRRFKFLQLTVQPGPVRVSRPGYLAENFQLICPPADGSSSSSSCVPARVPGRELSTHLPTCRRFKFLQLTVQPGPVRVSRPGYLAENFQLICPPADGSSSSSSRFNPDQFVCPGQGTWPRTFNSSAHLPTVQVPPVRVSRPGYLAKNFQLICPPFDGSSSSSSRFNPDQFVCPGQGTWPRTFNSSAHLPTVQVPPAHGSTRTSSCVPARVPGRELSTHLPTCQRFKFLQFVCPGQGTWPRTFNSSAHLSTVQVPPAHGSTRTSSCVPARVPGRELSTHLPTCRRFKFLQLTVQPGPVRVSRPGYLAENFQLICSAADGSSSSSSRFYPDNLVTPGPRLGRLDCFDSALRLSIKVGISISF